MSAAYMAKMNDTLFYFNVYVIIYIVNSHIYVYCGTILTDGVVGFPLSKFF